MVDGQSKYSRRYKFNEKDFHAAVICALIESASGITRGVPCKSKLLKFVKSIIDSTYKKSNIPVEALTLEATVSAHMFIDSKIPLNKRIQMSKKLKSLLLRIMLTTKFIELWVTDNNLDIVEIWQKVRKALFNAKVIKRFSQKICHKTRDSSIDFDLQELRKQANSEPQLRQALRAWSEISMTFTGATLLSTEMRNYFSRKFNLQLNIHADNLETAALAIYTTV